MTSLSKVKLDIDWTLVPKFNTINTERNIEIRDRVNIFRIRDISI